MYIKHIHTNKVNKSKIMPKTITPNGNKQVSNGASIKTKKTCKIVPDSQARKSIRMFKCDIGNCTYQAKRKTHLKSHKANIHDIDVVWHFCDHCPAKFKRASNLKEHKQNKHDIDVVWNYCNICTYRCKQKGNLKKHKALLHNIGRDAYEWRKCDLCSYKCIDKSRLKQHKANIHDIDVVWYNCNLCAYKSKRMCDLRTHKLYKHDIGVVWHDCNMCLYKCKRASDLKRHKLNNHSAVTLMEYFAEKSFEQAAAQAMLNMIPSASNEVSNDVDDVVESGSTSMKPEIVVKKKTSFRRRIE